MTPFTCVNTVTGEVMFSGVGGDPAGLESEGCQVILEQAPANSYRDLVNDTWEAIPARPSSNHLWSWGSKAWVDPRTLADHKVAQIRVLKLARDTHLTSGFEWDGSSFDSDHVSQLRLLGLKQKALEDSNLSENWRLQDNSWRTLNAANALAVWAAFEDHLRDSFITFAGLEAAVLAADTVEEVAAVTWPE